MTITQTPTGPLITTGNTDDKITRYNKSYSNISTPMYNRHVDSVVICSLKLCELFTYYLDNVLDYYEEYPPSMNTSVVLTTFFNDILLQLIDK